MTEDSRLTVKNTPRGPAELALIREEEDLRLRDLLSADEELADAAKDILRDWSGSANTQKAYGNAWQQFEGWCKSHGLLALPAQPKVVMIYIANLARQGRKVSTIKQAVAVISKAHSVAFPDETSPCSHKKIREALKELRRDRERGRKPVRALLVEDLVEAIRACPSSLRGTRDRALLSFGWSTACRRSEIADMTVTQVEFRDRGVQVTIEYSKTSQGGEDPRTPFVSWGGSEDTCPVKLLQRWLEEANILEGHIFRAISGSSNIEEGRMSDRTVALIVKRAVKRIGLNPEEYSGHSLRRGFITTRARQGYPAREIAQQTGHKTLAVLEDYVEKQRAFIAEPTKGSGL